MNITPAGSARLLIGLCLGLLIFVLSSCGAQHDLTGELGPPPKPNINPPSAKTLMHSIGKQDIGVRLTGPLKIQHEGLARFDIRFSNESNGKLEAELGGSGFGTIVTTRDGAIVWQNSDPEQSMIQFVELRPGEARVFHWSWNVTDSTGEAVPAGSYLVAAHVKLLNRRLESNTLPISIVE